MAATKFSGLAAVAAFLTTHEWGVNEAGTSKKVNGAQVLAVVAGGAAGKYVQATSNQLGITAATDLTSLSQSITPVVGRRLILVAQIQLNQITNPGVTTLTFQEGATVLGTSVNTLNPASNSTQTVLFAQLITPTAAAHTYKVTLASSAASVGAVASATAPNWFVILDMGT